jgi:hypothetical protein
LETNNIEEPETEVEIQDPKAVLSALERAKGDAKKFREEKEKLEVDLSSKDQIIADYSGKLLREKVMQKMAQEGIKDPQRVLKFVDLSKLEFDNDLEVIGFEDEFESVKRDLPELFDPRLRVGGQADSAVQASVSTQYSATQLQAAKILGKL